MKKNSKATVAFKQKLDELQQEIQPALYGHNLKEIILYEKLMDIEEKLNKLTEEIEQK